jgi:hypothetical protein
MGNGRNMAVCSNPPPFVGLRSVHARVFRTSSGVDQRRLPARAVPARRRQVPGTSTIRSLPRRRHGWGFADHRGLKWLTPLICDIARPGPAISRCSASGVELKVSPGRETPVRRPRAGRVCNVHARFGGSNSKSEGLWLVRRFGSVFSWVEWRDGGMPVVKVAVSPPRRWTAADEASRERQHRR